MKCLTHIKDNSRVARDDRELLLGTLQLLTLAVAVELHETNGFGARRLDSLFLASIGNIWTAMNMYDLRDGLEVLAKRARDFGFAQQIHFDAQGRIQWGDSAFGVIKHE